MTKQPEQILEEQLVAQIKAWDVYLADVKPFNILKTSNIKNLILKMFTELKKGVTLAPTVPLLLPVRSAQGSFSIRSNFTNNNTPPMPLHDAHLGGFFFL
jgi:hypothetical protein